MSAIQKKINFPARKSTRRRTMKIQEVEDKENSPTKKALISPEKLLPQSPIRQNRQPDFKQLQQLDYQETSSQAIPRRLFPVETPSKIIPKVEESIPVNLPDYKKTKMALHTSLPENLVGREAELKLVDDFVRGHVEGHTSGSMYMSGAPGTGKTAVLFKIINSLSDKVHKVYINCMSHKNSNSIYSAIHSSLQPLFPSKRKSICKTPTSASKVSLQKFSKEITKWLISTHKPIIMVLDEIDSLDSRYQEVLYTIFEWPSLADSSLILIGISNSLDLTDRILPRLKVATNLLPTLVNFPPYYDSSIIQIITDRVKHLGIKSAIETPAIMFCARKVSCMTGDVRVALDICRRSVELMESKVSKMHPDELHSTTSTKVTIPIMMSVINEVYGQKITPVSSFLSSTFSPSSACLPLQQLLLLCTMLLATKRMASKEIFIGKLHELYASVCKRNASTAICISSFIDVCSNLHDRGVINVKKSKEVRNGKVSLRVDENDLKSMVQDTKLLSSILSKGL